MSEKLALTVAAALASAMLAIAVFFLALARRQRRREMIEFLAHMPTDTMIFLTMAVLGLAAMVIVLRRLI